MVGGTWVLTCSEQDKWVGEILRKSYEAISLEDLGSQILPLFDDLFETSTSLVYRCNERREFVPIAGALSEATHYYSMHYYPIDPTQRAARRLNLSIFHAPSVPEWGEFLKHPVHTEFLTRYGFDNYIHLKLSACGLHEPGMVGIVLARTARQPDFSERERMLLGNLLPALESLARRSERIDVQLQSQPYLESLLDFSPRPKVIFDSRGGLVWGSERAETLLGLKREGRKNVPDGLIKAARK